MYQWDSPAEAADAARRHLAASPWPAVLARGDDPPEPPKPPEPTPSVPAGGPGSRRPWDLRGFAEARSICPGADAARRHLAASPWPAVLARGDDSPEPPEPP